MSGPYRKELPKPVRHKLNEIVGAAHTEAMRRALASLAADFDRWRRGEIDPFELAERVHKFHDGVSREIYNRFAIRKNSALPSLAASSLVDGLIQEKDIPPEVMPHIAALVKLFREEMGDPE